MLLQQKTCHIYVLEHIYQIYPWKQSWNVSNLSVQSFSDDVIQRLYQAYFLVQFSVREGGGIGEAALITIRLVESLRRAEVKRDGGADTTTHRGSGNHSMGIWKVHPHVFPPSRSMLQKHCFLSGFTDCIGALGQNLEMEL